MKTPVIALLCSLVLAACSEERQPQRPPWSAEIVNSFARLPVQEGGRIKPLGTQASFAMLRINGKRSFKTEWGETLSPATWLLDVLLYPEIAKTYRCFRIDNDEVLDAIDVSHAGRGRLDRYSWRELSPAREKLMQLARRYSKISEKKRSRVQRQIMTLAQSYLEFTELRAFFDFARERFAVAGSEGLRILFKGRKTASFTGVLERLGAIHFLVQKVRETAQGADPQKDARRHAELDAVGELLARVETAGRRANAISLIVPDVPRSRTELWLSPGGVAFSDDASKAQLALVRRLEDLVSARDDRARFAGILGDFLAKIRNLAAARGEADKVDLEVTFYRGDFFFRALGFYVLAFLLLALSWLRPNSRWLKKLLLPGVALPTLLVITGVVLRCVIRGRPPVSNLYETILFITSIVVTVSLIIELINRKRIALTLGAALGMIGMFVAIRFEALEGHDTMRPLVAVLDTNFWLATHVTTVTIGYAAGLLAAGIANVFLLGKLFGFRRGSHAFYHGIARMVYGVVCFGLVFSVVGTILGGIWANDSWGRFWGWDPKENGALMIVLWNILILHGRLGGYLRDWGISIMALLGGCVVAFSWWGVNLLGEGLHSYGFIQGIWSSLIAFYVVQGGVLAGGLLAWHLEQERQRIRRQVESAARAGESTA